MSSFKNFARKTQPLAWATPKKAGPKKPFNIWTDLKPGDRLEYFDRCNNRWKPGVFVRYGDIRVHSWEQPTDIWANWGGDQRETYVNNDNEVRLLVEVRE